MCGPVLPCAHTKETLLYINNQVHRIYIYTYIYVYTHTYKVHTVLFSTNPVELRNALVTNLSLLKEIKEERRKERKKARLHFDRNHSYH